jgi:dihydrofolate reductase
MFFRRCFSSLHYLLVVGAVQAERLQLMSLLISRIVFSTFQRKICERSFASVLTSKFGTLGSHGKEVRKSWKNFSMSSQEAKEVGRPECVVYIATSLDGFIAKPDGDLGWLDQARAQIPEGNDCGYSEMYGSIDAVVMGRASFEKVLSFNIPWPYADRHVYVLTRGSVSAVTFPEDLKEKVTVVQISGPQELKDFCKRIVDQKKFKRLYIDGGQVIDSFFEIGFVDEMTITVIPVLLGEGIRLFGGKSVALLKLLGVQHFNYGRGLMQMKYKVLHEI